MAYPSTASGYGRLSDLGFLQNLGRLTGLGFVPQLGLYDDNTIAFNLELEDGDDLLLENGDYILLES